MHLLNYKRPARITHHRQTPERRRKYTIALPNAIKAIFGTLYQMAHSSIRTAIPACLIIRFDSLTVYCP
jgi:hypothetical protein